MPEQLLPLSSPGERPLKEFLKRFKFTLTLFLMLAAHVGLVWFEGPRMSLIAPVFLIVLYYTGFILVGDRSVLSLCTLLTGLVSLAVSVVVLATGSQALAVPALIGFAVFDGLLIAYLLRYLFRARQVSLDSIMAGIIVYLLAGGLWAQLYSLVELFHPGSILVLGGPLGGSGLAKIYYFSIITLTTAGFGDVVPVTDLVRILAAYEALLGQVYLVVFIALLMGRHFATAAARKDG